MIDFLFLSFNKKMIKILTGRCKINLFIENRLNIFRLTLSIVCAGKPKNIMQQFVRIVVITCSVFQEIILRVTFARV